MRTRTTSNKLLDARILDKDTRPSIAFYWLDCGGLCSVYFVETFLEIEEGKGLCLGVFDEKEYLDLAVVTKCKVFIDKELGGADA